MTPPTTSSDSPQSRLAASRKALVRQMAWINGRLENNISDDLLETDHGKVSGDTSIGRRSIWQVVIQAAVAGWQHHPMHIAFDIGRPFLTKLARDKPGQLLGISAVFGAAAVVVKPWRLVSLTGLVLAALKSTKLSSTLLSLLTRSAARSRTEKTQPPSRNI